MLPTKSRPTALPLSIVGLALALGLAGCGSPAAGGGGEPGQRDIAGNSSPSSRPSSCPPRGEAHDGGSTAIVEWIDFVHLNGRQYVAGPGETRPVSPSDVGAKVGTVACRMAGSAAGPSYRFHDGDAGVLPPGTVVYAIRGIPPTRAVTAARDGRYSMYAVQPSD